MTQSTALQIREYSQEELQVIQQTIAKGTTPQQFQLFMKTAQYAGLNPFLNHIYCIVYGQGQNATMSIQISVEGIVYLAKQHPDYRGYDVQLVHENDEFKARKIRHENGQDSWEIVTHEVGFPRGKVIGGYAIAYREGFRPFVVLMDFEEVQHNLTGTNAAIWKKHTNDMFKKHMLKRAIKGQFGIEIAEDDVPAVGSVDNIPEYQPQRKDITAEVEVTEVKEQPPSEDDEAAKLKKARAEMKKKFALLGITDPEAMAAYIEQHAKPKGDKPTLAEMMGLLKIMDMHIAEKQAQAANDDELV